MPFGGTGIRHGLQHHVLGAQPIGELKCARARTLVTLKQRATQSATQCAAILAVAYASTAFESHGLILYPLIRIEYTRVQYCAAKSASASHCLRPTIASGELHERSRHPSWGPSSSTGCYGPTANHSARHSNTGSECGAAQGSS